MWHQEQNTHSPYSAQLSSFVLESCYGNWSQFGTKFTACKRFFSIRNLHHAQSFSFISLPSCNVRKDEYITHLAECKALWSLSQESTDGFFPSKISSCIFASYQTSGSSLTQLFATNDSCSVWNSLIFFYSFLDLCIPRYFEHDPSQVLTVVVLHAQCVRCKIHFTQHITLLFAQMTSKQHNGAPALTVKWMMQAASSSCCWI